MITKIKLLLKLTFLFAITISFLLAEKIDNIKTEDHFHIPGTKFAIIPPEESFINSSEYTGLQNKELETGINITQFPMPYDSVLLLFTNDIPPKNGELLFEKDFVINGFKSKLFKTKTTNSIIAESFDKTPNSEKTITWILLSGNNELTFVLTSAYKYSLDDVLSIRIKKSLLSFVYLKDKEVNPIEQLSFTVDISQSDLKFATILMQTGVAYTIDGEFPTEAKNKSNYMIMAMPFGTEENKREQRAIRNLNKPSDKVKIEQIEKVTIDGLSGYEIIGYEDKGNNKKVLKYGTTLFDKEKQYRIVGTSNHNFEKNLIQFQKITRSFNQK